MRDPRSELDDLAERDLLRHVRCLESTNGRKVVLDGRELINFSSNDYLGLTGDPRLSAAAISAIETYGTTTVASRLIFGGGPLHRQLEDSAAEFFGKERALCFANGYGTAAGVLTSILRKGDTAIIDKRSHASLIDGARLSGATVRVFPHNGLPKLERLLASSNGSNSADSRVVVITESVFSMDGDLCPLPEIVRLKKQHGALLLLDEAHAFGVLGPSGRGLAHREGLADDIDLLLATFGKSAASAGGCVAASEDWIELIANRARSFIYSTAPPPAQAAASNAAIDVIGSPDGDRLREQLHHNVDRFCDAMGLPSPGAAIVPIVIGAERNALEASESLRRDGFLVPAIRYPTVAKGAARLRISLSAAHTAADIDQFAQALRSL